MLQLSVLEVWGKRLGFLEEDFSPRAVYLSCVAWLVLAVFSKERSEEMYEGLWHCLWKQTSSFIALGW